MAIQKIKGRTYAEIMYQGANVSAVVTSGGLVLIDIPGLPRELRQWLGELDRLTGKDIAYLITTDHHFDHALSNALVTKSVIAHELSRQETLTPGRNLIHLAEPWREVDSAGVDEMLRIEQGLPRFTFRDRMRLYLGDATFELIHLGGHTPATIMVYLMEDKILFSGDDVEADCHPYKGQACFRDWITAIERIMTMDIDVIVPGHGPVCDKAEAARMLSYFRQLWDQVKSLYDRGYSRDEVVKRLRPMQDYYPIDPAIEQRTRQRFDEGTARLYDEIASLYGGGY